LFVAIFLLGLSAVLSVQTQDRGGVEKGWKDEMAKFTPIGDSSMKIQTVKHATMEFFNAWQIHNFGTVMRFIGQHSQFLINSLLPSNGYYTGKRGYMQMFDRWFRTAVIQDATYRINFVDEARQVSVVTYSCSGIVRHNGASFENMKVVIFIKWDMGKISKFNLVELNPEKTYSLFLTKAHNQFIKFLDGLCRGGKDLRNAIDRYVSNDVSMTFNNIYPLSLVVNEANATKYDGKDVIATLKGKDNALNLALLGDKLCNLISTVKVLYSDDTTVVAATIFKPTTKLFLTNKQNYWKTVTILYTINRFDDKGMLKESQLYVNRPFLPNQLRSLHSLFESDASLSSLLATVRGSINIDAAKAIDAGAKTNIGAAAVRS